jgi:hypothetical protein
MIARWHQVGKKADKAATEISTGSANYTEGSTGRIPFLNLMIAQHRIKGMAEAQ